MINKNVIKDVDWLLYTDAPFPSHSNFKNIKNQRFGKITVRVYAGLNEDRHPTWHVQCDCGNSILYMKAHSLTRANGTTSCGCLVGKSDTKRPNRGLKGTLEYHSWQSMKARCYNENHDKYYMYGGKGTTVCERWLDKENGFSNFLEDMGKRPSMDFSIERIDNDGNYEPGNCKWANATEQTRNRKNTIRVNYNNKTQTLMEWSVELNMDYNTLRARRSAGWTVEKMFNTPVRKSPAKL